MWGTRDHHPDSCSITVYLSRPSVLSCRKWSYDAGCRPRRGNTRNVGTCRDTTARQNGFCGRRDRSSQCVSKWDWLVWPTSSKVRSLLNRCPILWCPRVVELMSPATGALCQFGQAVIICSISQGGRHSPTDHANVPLSGGLYFGLSTMNVTPQCMRLTVHAGYLSGMTLIWRGCRYTTTVIYD